MQRIDSDLHASELLYFSAHSQNFEGKFEDYCQSHVQTGSISSNTGFKFHEQFLKYRLPYHQMIFF